jgi:hypothetical protein
LPINTYKDRIADLQADSLMDLLVAQCADLESLLTLARQEMAAAANNDFDQLVAIAVERATLGDRLESYHRQIAEMRTAMGAMAGAVGESPIGKQTTKIVEAILAQDAKTKSLVSANRTRTALTIARLDQGWRSSSAYMRDARMGGLKLDQKA